MVARSLLVLHMHKHVYGTNYYDKNGTRHLHFVPRLPCTLWTTTDIWLPCSESPPTPTALRTTTTDNGNTYWYRATPLTRTNPNKIRISAIISQATHAITYHRLMIWLIQRARAEEFVIVPVGLHSFFPICSAVPGYPLWYKRGTKMFFFLLTQCKHVQRWSLSFSVFFCPSCFFSLYPPISPAARQIWALHQCVSLIGVVVHMVLCNSSYLCFLLLEKYMLFILHFSYS